MKVDYAAFLTKTALLLALLALTPWPWSPFVGLLAVWGYQYLVAWWHGAIAMPTMDTIVFLGDDDVRVNFISFTVIERTDFATVQKRIRGFMRDKAKLRWRIVKIWGDLYWQDTAVEESIDYVFQPIPTECHNERDIERVVNDDLNRQMPFDKPQWRMWFQENY